MLDLEKLRDTLRNGGMEEEEIKTFLEDPECYDVMREMAELTSGVEGYVARKGICREASLLPLMEKCSDIYRCAYSDTTESTIPGGHEVSLEKPEIREALKGGKSYREIWREKRIFRGVTVEEMFFSRDEVDLLASLWNEAFPLAGRDFASDSEWERWGKEYAEVQYLYLEECRKWVHEIFPQYKDDPSTLEELRKTAPNPKDFYEPHDSR